MFKPFIVLDLYKYIQPSGKLFPVSTSFDFWDNVYTSNAAKYDREFARRFASFRYFDFMKAETEAEALNNFKADVLSILEMNQKTYEEIYRLYVIDNEDMPITYNYDMTETTGAQKLTDTYGGTSFTKGQQQNTEGQRTDTHNVAPFNSTTPIAESSDVKDSQTFTDGERTDTTLQHMDTHEHDQWTLTRRGNIGIETSSDIAKKFNSFWTNDFKYMDLIFKDIATQLLLVGE